MILKVKHVYIIFGKMHYFTLEDLISLVWFACLHYWPPPKLLLRYNKRICIQSLLHIFTGPKVVKPQKNSVPAPSPQSSVSRPPSSTGVSGKKRSVARKSTTGSSQSNQSIVSSSPMSEGELQMSKWEAPWLKKRQPATNTNAGTKKSRGKGQVEIVENSQEMWRIFIILNLMSPWNNFKI